jgi:light-regulated signal transduction histidine kinase (bacteriophytochrome)
METVQELRKEFIADAEANGVGIQSGGYLIELSLDWIVLRASENIHHLLGESHVTLIDEPLGRFVQAQALHDLRNLFSRLSGTTGIARAYGVRLTDDRALHDIAFQLSDGRVILEAVPSASETFGQAFGSIGGLIASLGDASGQALLDGGARRMRALTGYDRVTLFLGDQRAESSRGAYSARAERDENLPLLVADSEAATVAIFPRKSDDTSVSAALMKASKLDTLRGAEVRSVMRVLFDGGEFRCDGRLPREPRLEVHAAAELFAQMFAMRMGADRLKNG